MIACPRPSNLDRGFHCPGSFALQQIEETSEYAEDGTEDHAELAQAVRMDCKTADGFDPASVLPASRRHTVEQKIWWDMASDAVECSSERPKKEGDWIGGTPDVITINEDGTATVTDWKTGYEPVDAATSWQLRCYAVMVARFGRTSVTVQVVQGTGPSRPVNRTTFDEIDLDAFAIQIRAIVERIRRQDPAQPELAAGEWCKYCPAISVCPAKISLVRALVSPAADVSDRVASMSREEAGIAWLKLMEVGDILDRIKAALLERIHHEPLPLPDGRVVTLRQEVRRSVNGRLALPILRETIPNADDLAKVTVSITDIEAGAKKAGVSPADVINKLDAAGAISRAVIEKPAITKRAS